MTSVYRRRLFVPINPVHNVTFDRLSLRTTSSGTAFTSLAAVRAHHISIGTILARQPRALNTFASWTTVCTSNSLTILSLWTFYHVHWTCHCCLSQIYSGDNHETDAHHQHNVFSNCRHSHFFYRREFFKSLLSDSRRATNFNVILKTHDAIL